VELLEAYNLPAVLSALIRSVLSVNACRRLRWQNITTATMIPWEGSRALFVHSKDVPHRVPIGDAMI
jgi:hypothetical protein